MNKTELGLGWCICCPTVAGWGDFEHGIGVPPLLVLGDFGVHTETPMVGADQNFMAVMGPVSVTFCLNAGERIHIGPSVYCWSCG